MPHDKRKLTTREAMIYVADMAAHAPKPDRYRWTAKWWRLHSRESANSGECLHFANGQMALYRDMMQRPEHYTDTLRPSGVTDWLWSGLAHNEKVNSAPVGSPVERSGTKVERNVRGI